MCSSATWEKVITNQVIEQEQAGGSPPACSCSIYLKSLHGLHSRLRGNEITDPDLGEDIKRAGRIRLQLVPEAVHVHLENVTFPHVLGTPDML